MHALGCPLMLASPHARFAAAMGRTGDGVAGVAGGVIGGLSGMTGIAGMKIYSRLSDSAFRRIVLPLLTLAGLALLASAVSSRGD
jgi:hypothetical protein